MALHPTGRHAGYTLWVGEALLIEQSFFPAPPLETLREQKSISRDAEGRMVMKTSPPPSLIVGETEFLLELLVVLLDAPTHLGGGDQLLKRRLRREGRV
jgi:hypothetical protein